MHGTKSALKRAYSSARPSLQQLLDPNHQFELGEVRPSHLLALLAGVAVLGVVYWRSGSTPLLLWFVPVWFLIVGLERLWVRRRDYRQPGLWLLNSWLSHWELLLASSTATSFFIYPRSASLHWNETILLACRFAASVWALNSITLLGQLLGLGVVLAIQSAALATKLTACTQDWLWVELSTAVVIASVVLGLILYYSLR